MSTRRLAAILAADVVGFSSMMEKDEEGTASQIRAVRREIIEPKLSAHQGRLIKTTGDGFLAEFASPVEAVRCALGIQDTIAERGEANGGLKLRIGINLGDIIIEDDGDVFGDGGAADREEKLLSGRRIGRDDREGHARRCASFTPVCKPSPWYEGPTSSIQCRCYA